MRNRFVAPKIVFGAYTIYEIERSYSGLVYLAEKFEAFVMSLWKSAQEQVATLWFQLLDHTDDIYWWIAVCLYINNFWGLALTWDAKYIIYHSIFYGINNSNLYLMQLTHDYLLLLRRDARATVACSAPSEPLFQPALIISIQPPLL